MSNLLPWTERKDGKDVWFHADLLATPWSNWACYAQEHYWRCVTSERHFSGPALGYDDAKRQCEAALVVLGVAPLPPWAADGTLTLSPCMAYIDEHSPNEPIVWKVWCRTKQVAMGKIDCAEGRKQEAMQDAELVLRAVLTRELWGGRLGGTTQVQLDELRAQEGTR